MRSIALLLCLAGTSTGCSGLPAGILQPPERNVLPDYRGRDTARHRVASVLWRVALVEPAAFSREGHHHGVPAVNRDGSRVFAGGMDGSIHCLDAGTGRPIWRRFVDGPVEGEPTVTADMVYVGSSGGELTALRASDGEVLWTYQVPAALDGKPVLAGDRLLVMTNANNLIALQAQTGAWLWTYRREVPSGRFQVHGLADPAVAGDNVYAGFSDGFLAHLSLQDGSVRSLKRLSGKNGRFHDADTDPVLLDDMLVCGSFSGGLRALKPDTLDEIWVYPAEGPSDLALSDETTAYFTTADAHVVALDLQTGKPSWIFDAKKGTLSRPVLAGNWLLVASSEYSLFALDRASGKLVQIFNPGKGSYAAPVVHGDRAYWVSNGEILYAMGMIR